MECLSVPATRRVDPRVRVSNLIDHPKLSGRIPNPAILGSQRTATVMVSHAQLDKLRALQVNYLCIRND